MTTTTKQATTRKEITKNGTPVFSAHYCEIYALLRGLSASGYNAGKLGWNWDAYTLDTNAGSVCICTGYRNLTGTPILHEIAKKYNKLADTMTSGRNLYSWNKQLDGLRSAFVKELLNTMEV